MPTSHRKTHTMSRWVYRYAERLPAEQWESVPQETRGVYALLERRRGGNSFDVLYVGISNSGIRSRLRAHSRSAAKKGWTHFSLFEVWPNVTEDELRQLEGLLRHIYRGDSRANLFNKQKRMHILRKVKDNQIAEWPRIPLAGQLGRAQRGRK